MIIEVQDLKGPFSEYIIENIFSEFVMKTGTFLQQFEIFSIVLWRVF